MGMHVGVFNSIVTFVLRTLAGLGGTGVVSAAMFLSVASIAGTRLTRICKPEQSVLLVVPRTVGLLLSFSAQMLLIVVTTILAVIHGHIMTVTARGDAQWLADSWDQIVSYWPNALAGVIAGSILGASGWYAIGRWLEPWVAAILHRLTRRSKEQSLTDVRDLNNVLPRPRKFDPKEHFANAREHGSIFLGLDEHGQDVLLPRSIWCKTHGQLLGATGSGKGVEAGVILAQGVSLYGDAVIVFDPKDDEWAPHVLRSACQDAGLPFTLVDLRDQVPRLNLIANASSAELNELLIAGFSLTRTGGDSDFYRIKDRKAARLLSQNAKHRACVADLHDHALGVLGEDLSKAACGLLGQLEELADLPVIQTSTGFDVESVIKGGGCLYIIGSTRDEAIITLQRMLLVRIMQTIEKRSRAQERRHVTIFLDEFKYMLSLPALSALGTIRDKGANVLIAHQSLGDFADCGPTISAESVRAVVLDNTGIKWIYTRKDKATADWASGLTGSIVVGTERREISRNDALSEWAGGQVVVSQVQRPLIDTNMVQHLPEGCALFVSGGLARLAFASPILVSKRTLHCAPAAPLYERTGVAGDPFDDDPDDDHDQGDGHAYGQGGDLL